MLDLAVAAVILWIVVLVARFISVSASYEAVKRSLNISTAKSIVVLTWGGLRGGISIALALSLPESEIGFSLIFMTYVVVIMSILIQGLTIGKLVQSLKLGV